MHLEVLIDEAFVETAILIHYLDFVYCVLTIPNTHNSTSFEQVRTLPPFIACFESTDEFLARRLNDDATAMPLAHEPLSFINFAIGVKVRADSMPHVVFDLPFVLVFSIPSTFLLAARLEYAQKMLICSPIVEALSVKHIIAIVPIVVLPILEDLES